MKYLLGEKLHFDWKVVTITIVSTLLLMVDYYHRLTPYKYWDRVILYLVIPLLIIIFLFRENPKEFGFSLGDWKAGLCHHCNRHSADGSNHLLSRSWRRIHAGLL